MQTTPVATIEITLWDWNEKATEIGWTVHRAPPELGTAYVGPLFRIAENACRAQAEFNEGIETNDR